MRAEFDLIARHFQRAPRRADVRLGVGDDAALLVPASGTELVMTADTLVAGVHFLPDTAPAALGHKALAVNLSDLAAMGAQPAWALLALTLPPDHAPWVAAFMRGFDALARRVGIELVGGDTTSGPLVITVTAVGQVPAGQALRRSGARVGDAIYLSGSVGGAGAGLGHRRGRGGLPGAAARAACARLDRPQPRLTLGRALRGVASAAIDVSDGLAPDQGPILEERGVAARVALADLPIGPGVADTPAGRVAALSAGDDYELCFTASPAADVQAAARAARCPVTRIGTVERRAGLRVVDANGRRVRLARTGYVHRV